LCHDRYEIGQLANFVLKTRWASLYTYTSNCCDTARLVPDFNDSLSGVV